MSTHPEERVLRPLDPVPEDTNEWPDFALREVKIFYQGKGRYADLLEASEETPLCVLGELMPLEDEFEHLGVFLTRLESFLACLGKVARTSSRYMKCHVIGHMPTHLRPLQRTNPSLRLIVSQHFCRIQCMLV
jgi:hypothetical protein